MASATGAQAAIQYFTTTITSDSSTPGNVAWNIDGLGAVEANLNNTVNGGSIYIKNITVGSAAGFGVVTNGFNLIPGLASNQPIGSADNFSSSVDSVFYGGGLFSVSNISSVVATYIGFKFNPEGTELYGWANVTFTQEGNWGTITITEWAYDDTGASILTGATGAIPEPANFAVGLGALALGAAGLRRRRRARAVAA